MKSGKSPLSRSMIFKILIFFWLITMTILGMKPFQASITEAVRLLKANFIGKLEDFTGMEIRYSSLRPSLFGSIDIKNLRLLKNNEIFFSVNRIRIKFSVRDLILRKTAFIHTVQVDYPQINIDMARDMETFEHIINSGLIVFNNDFIEVLDQISQFIPENVDYLIRHCNFSLKDKNTIYKIEDMNINLWRLNENIHFNGKLGAQISFDELFNKKILFNTDIGIDAVCSNNFNNSNINISISDFTCSELDEKKHVNLLFSFIPENISILLQERMISIESNNKSSKNIEYFFKYDLDTSDFFANLDFNNFYLADKIKFSNQLKDASNLVKLQLTGTSFFGYIDKQMDYNVNLLGISSISNHVNNDLIIRLNGNDKTIKIDNLSINSSSINNTENPMLFLGKVDIQGSMDFESVQPKGVIILDRFSLTGKEYLSTVFNISSNKNEIKIFSDNINIAKTQISDFNLLIYPSQKETGISFSSFLKDKGAVYLDAVYNYIPDDNLKKETRELEASLTLASVSLYEITEITRPFVDYLDITPINSLLRNTIIDTEIFFSTDFNNIVFNAPNIIMDIDGSLGMLSVSGTDRQLTVSEGLFNIKNDDILISANINYSNPLELLFSVDVSYNDLSWNIDGHFFDKTTLIINNQQGLNIYGNLANNMISGYIEGVDFPILAKTKSDALQIIYLNFLINLRYDSMELWNFDINHLTAREQNGSTGMEFLRISGNANQNGASFKDINYNDLTGMLTGTADFTWDNDFSSIEFIFNMTDGRAYGEYYDIEGIYKDEKININAFVKDIHINRFLNETNTMLLSADASLTWDSINSFNAFLNVTSFYANIQNNPVNAEVKVNLSHDEFILQNLNLKFGSLNASLPEFKINRNEGTTSGLASFNTKSINTNLDGMINLDINFSNTDSWFDLKRALNTFKGNVKIFNLIYNDENIDPFSFIFAGNEGAYSFSGGIRDMIRVEIDSEGVFYAGLSAPMPVQCSMSGTFKNGMIDAHCKNLFIDLESIWSTFMSYLDDFNIPAGYVTGTLDIRGPISNPEFFGSARGSSIRFKVPNYISEDLRLVPFEITAQGSEMTFGPFVTAVGGGNGIVNGYFQFDNWIPRIVNLDIKVPRESPIPYSFNISGFLAKGTSSGDLLLTVDLMNQALEIQGDLFTNNAVLGLNIEEIMYQPEIIRDEKALYTAVDMKITFGSASEFLWPGSSPILRAYPEMGTVINVSSDARSGQFSLNSDVGIRSGELYYFDRSFYIRKGSLIFRESETRFDPMFNARAEIRDRSESGPVTISMIVENQPLLSFIPRFEAAPGLTQLEIFSILGQNMSGQGYESAEMAQRFLISSATDILTQVASNSDLFARLNFLRFIERHVRSFLRLDMFTIRTRFVPNLVATGATGGFSQSSENNRGNRVGNYFDNTTVFIGKYIGQDMFIQGMLTMKYDENSSLLGGIRFEPDIGIELQSPFINIRWDFFPRHPHNLLVNDNSITLSWSKSF